MQRLLSIHGRTNCVPEGLADLVTRSIQTTVQRKRGYVGVARGRRQATHYRHALALRSWQALGVDVASDAVLGPVSMIFAPLVVFHRYEVLVGVLAQAGTDACCYIVATA